MNGHVQQPLMQRELVGPQHGKKKQAASMHGRPEQAQCQIDARTERLIVLQLIGSEHAVERSRLYRSLADIDTAELEAAVSRLVSDGVIDAQATSVSSSAALVRLNRLRMICL
jgi:hypothetical protein